MRSALPAVILMGFGAACGKKEQAAVPPEPLPIATDTVKVPFTSLPAAASVGDRRWVVVDGDGHGIAFVDFAKRSFQLVESGKDTAVRQPFLVFALGDTAYVGDWGKQWLGKWSADGKFQGGVPAPRQTFGVLPQIRDAAGQYYFEIAPPYGPNGVGLTESTAIVRSDPTFTKFDTIGMVAPADYVVSHDSGATTYTKAALGGTDAWGVRPNGQLWIARAQGNSVWFYKGGKALRGDPLPDPVFEVSPLDRKLYVKSFPPEMQKMAERVKFALFKPPFDRALPSADGLIWLRKSTMALDSVRKYQVIDTAGRYVRQFTTVGPGIIVAVSPTHALMVQRSGQELLLLEVAIPAPRPATEVTARGAATSN